MRWKMSDDSKSIKWSTMTKCHLPWTHSVFCHSKDKSLASEWWSRVFFLLRNRDLTLCVINDLRYYFDWMSVCYIPNVTDFSSNAADLKSVPAHFSEVCAAWKLPQWHATAVGNDSVTHDAPVEQGDKPDDLSRSLSGSVGGCDGPMAGSILVKWYFFFRQSTNYGKICILSVIFLLFCFLLLYCPS